MSGIGRNNPCPCGSGRKYKKCCLATEPVTALAYAPTDAWTVWLASGLILGLLVAPFHHRWIVPLAGAAIGAAVFALVLPSGMSAQACMHAFIEPKGASPTVPPSALIGAPVQFFSTAVQ